MKNIFTVLGFIVILICLSGCVTPQEPSPATVQIHTTASPDRVKSAIIEVYTSDGWHIEHETDHMISFVIENATPMVKFVYSSNDRYLRPDLFTLEKYR